MSASKFKFEFEPISEDGCWQRVSVDGGYIYHHEARYLSAGKEVASECAVFVPYIRRKEDGQ